MVYMSINLPGRYYVIETSKSSELQEFFRIEALVPAMEGIAQRVSDLDTSKLHEAWFGFYIDEEELPRQRKVKKAFPEKEVKPLTFTLADALKGVL